MRTRAAAAVVAVAAAVAAAGAGGCQSARKTGAGDAGATTDAAFVADAAPPDAAVAFAVQYTDPDHGPFTGGTQTTIRGVGFASDDTVLIGGRLATDVKRLDPKHLQVTTPAGTPGPADLEVRHSDGTSAIRAGGFTYEALAVSPPSGSVAGGTYVAITGLGTDFAPGALVTFDGVPATGVTVESAERLTCYTPPGTQGDANVVVVTPTTTYRADRGYTYYTTGDPYAGGLSGGPINGTLNVVVTDAYTRNGVPGAFVAIGDPNTTPWKGTTDALGQITFSGPGLHGPVDVVATADGYEVGTFHCFDAANLTIAIRPVVPPKPSGPPGVGTSNGTISGAIEFGDATGLGSPYWNLVPEPRTPTEIKRAYITTSGYSIFGGPPAATHVDYSYDPHTLAWPFTIPSRPGALAVVAVVGLYDPAKDPGGTGAQGFTPYALGVARGVLVGPTENVTGVDVVVNIPLDAAMRVDLVDPPPVGTAADGPLQHVVQAVVDMGGDGTIQFGAHGLPAAAGADPPQVFTLPAGASGVTLTSAPPLERAIGNASYTFLVGAFTYQGSPMSAKVVRGVRDVTAPVEVAGFLGVPRPVDPAPDSTASRRHAVFAPEHETLAPTFHLHYLYDDQGNPVWTGVACGAETDVALPDLSSIGRVWPPVDTKLFWVVWSIQVPGADYDQYTYRWNGSSYWGAYATDNAHVEFPP